MSFGRTIKLLRTSMGISQGDMAKVLDISPTYLSLIENDHRKPSQVLISVLARELGVPEGLLLLHLGTVSSLPDEVRNKVVEARNLVLQYALDRHEQLALWDENEE